MENIFRNSMGFPLGVLLALFTCTIQIDPAAGLDIKFSDIEKLTREGNTSIEASVLRYQSQEKRTGHLWKSFMPRFDLNGGYETFQTGVYGQKSQPYGALSARINLFNGFRDLNEGRVRAANSVLRRVESSVITNEKFSAARQLYLDLAHTKELESVYVAVFEMNGRVQKTARVRQNRGLVTSTDLYEFDLNGGRMKEEIESLRHERHILSIKLSAALGMEERHDLNPVDGLEHEHDDAMTKADYWNQPTAGSLRIQAEDSVRQAEASFRASWWMPSIEAYTGYYVHTLREREYLSIRDRDEWAAGFKANWSIFDFGQFSESRAAHFEEKASAKETKQRTLDFRAEVRARQEEMIHLHELIHYSEERLILGEKYLKSTQGDYDRGVKNSPDVISAIDKLITIRKELLERKLLYQRTRDRLATLVEKVAE